MAVDRNTIVTLHNKGESNSCVPKKLHIRGETVWKVVKKFKEIGETSNRPGQGRKQTVRRSVWWRHFVPNNLEDQFNRFVFARSVIIKTVKIFSYSIDCSLMLILILALIFFLRHPLYYETDNKILRYNPCSALPPSSNLKIPVHFFQFFHLFPQHQEKFCLTPCFTPMPYRWYRGGNPSHFTPMHYGSESLL